MLRIRLKIAFTYALALCQAWAPRQPTQQKNSFYSSSATQPSSTIPTRLFASRRQILTTIVPSISSILISSPAFAGLLDDYGTDPKKIETKKPDPPVAPAKPSSGTSQIDPTLRSSYYYPTAKKRYLPRIQKLSQELVAVPDAIAESNWELLEAFGKTADNAVLPLQLYQSSLDGQGLSLSTDFAKSMKQDALQFQSAYNLYAKALGRRDVDTLRVAVADMATAVADYRQQGRLTDDLLDASQIPSLEEMRRMAMRRPTVKQ